MRLRFFVVLAAGLALAADPPKDAPKGEGNPELTRAVRKATALDSYTFRIEEKPTAAVEGKYQKDRPVSFQADGIDFFRKGEVLVYRQGEQWQRSKTGTESDPLRILGAAARVRSARLPHEELANLDGHLKDVRREEDKGGAVYSGTLDDEAVKALVRSEYRSVARSGSARLWVNGDGQVTKYEVTIKVQGRLGNADIDGNTTRTVSVGDAGATRVEVPDGAKKALE
jgi:hypothetical protein